MAALGLDPGLGILHADMRNREGFVLDVLDAVRPVAERHVLRVLNEPLRRRGFTEDSRGCVRVLAPMTHRLAEAMPSFAVALAPVVETVGQMLGDSSAYDVDVPAYLSRSKHIEAARRRSKGNQQSRKAPRPSLNPAELRGRGNGKAKSRTDVEPPTCRSWGRVLPLRPKMGRRSSCDECLASDAIADHRSKGGQPSTAPTKPGRWGVKTPHPLHLTCPPELVALTAEYSPCGDFSGNEN